MKRILLTLLALVVACGILFIGSTCLYIYIGANLTGLAWWTFFLGSSLVIYPTMSWWYNYLIRRYLPKDYPDTKEGLLEWIDEMDEEIDQIDDDLMSGDLTSEQHQALEQRRQYLLTSIEVLENVYATIL